MMNKWQAAKTTDKHKKEQNKKSRELSVAEYARKKAELEKAAAEKAEARKKQEEERRIARKKREAERAEVERVRAEQAAKERERKAEIYALKRKKRQAFYAKMRNRLKNKPDGFDYRNYGFLQRVEIICTGDGTQLMSRLSAEKISVRDYDKSGGEIRFKIRKKELRKVIAILGEMCYNYRIGNRLGVGRLGAFFVARIGLAVGAVAAACCLNIAYGYVWRVDISGNEKLSDAEIAYALKTVGVTHGMRKRDLRISDITASVNKIDGVADASAEISGTTLYVHVLESKEFVSREKYSAYVSAFDATVTRIVTRSGTATIKRGTTVKAGDVLVTGDVYSTAGAILYSGECDAEVYGNVSLTFTADVASSSIEYRRTGKTAQKTVAELFGLKIGKTTSPYPNYESVSKTAHYDVFLPLYITTVRFYETAPVETERDLDEIAKGFAAAKAEELNFIGDFVSSYTINPTVSGLYSIHLFLSGEALISRGSNTAVAPKE